MPPTSSPDDEREVRPTEPSLWPGAALCAVAGTLVSLLAGFQLPINDDEIYQLHSIWLVAHGALPYREFFEIHPPGLWVLGAPFLRGDPPASTLLLSARAVIAVALGLSFGGLALLTAARGWRLGMLVLGALAGAVLTGAYLFRVEYLATALVITHGVVLAASGRRPRNWLWQAVAGAFVALAISMSLRAFPFVLVQPWLLWRSRSGWQDWVAWGLGLLLGVSPSLVFLTTRGLWGEAWHWCVGFAIQPDTFEGRPDHGVVGLIVFALAAAAARRLSRDRTGILCDHHRTVLLALWGAGAAYFLVNPQARHQYTVSGFYLCSAAVVACAMAPPLTQWGDRGSPWRRHLLVVVWLGLFVGLIVPPLVPPRPMALHQQFALLDWLDAVAADEGVLLIGPHHPVTVHNATDFQSAWHYVYWIDDPYLQPRIKGTATTLLEHPPPIMAANPWLRGTGGQDLIGWFETNGVADTAEAAALRALITREYSQVRVDGLEAPTRPFPYGATYWVRRDRLASNPPPEPATVGPPSFSTNP